MSEVNFLESLRKHIKRNAYCVSNEHENPEWVLEIPNVYHDCFICSGLSSVNFPCEVSIVRQDSSKSEIGRVFSDLRSLYKSIVHTFLSNKSRKEVVATVFSKNVCVSFEMYNDKNPQVLLDNIFEGIHV